RGRAPPLRGHLDFGALNARQALDSALRLVLDLILDRACGRRETDLEPHGAAFRADIAHESEAHDVALEVGVLDVTKRVQDVALGDGHSTLHRSLSLAVSTRSCQIGPRI